MYNIIDFEELDKIILDVYDSINLDTIPIYLSDERIIFNNFNPFNIERFFNKIDNIVSEHVCNSSNVIVNIIADPIIINNIMKFNYYFANNSLYNYQLCKSNKLISSDTIFIMININNSIIYCIKNCHDFISGKDSEMKNITSFKTIENDMYIIDSDNNTNNYIKIIYLILMILIILYIIK